MSEQNQNGIEFESDDFDFSDIEEEVRVDERCLTLLNSFHQQLLSRGHTPEEASELAFSADYYLRNYLLDFARQNVVRPRPGIVRRFAATWFITHTLDPEMRILERYLQAIREFYLFLHRQHFISAEELSWIEEEAAQTDYYCKRIESFLAIVNDGYIAWEAECPLRSDP
jgi:hypothetical protein